MTSIRLKRAGAAGSVPAALDDGEVAINEFDGLLFYKSRPSNAIKSVPLLERAAGAVAFFACSTAPSGWLKANGALVSRTTYASLFAAIGTTFGAGDGATTFALPDLRGEFARGLDDGRGVDTSRALGSAQAANASISVPGRLYGGPLSGGTGTYDLPTNTGIAGSMTLGSGETRPRNVALLACIKY